MPPWNIQLTWTAEQHSWTILYIYHDEGAKRLHPSFVNTYRSLIVNPSASLLNDDKNGDYSKVNILIVSRINKIYFTIKVFNYLYVGFKNVSLEDAATADAMSLLPYILKY